MNGEQNYSSRLMASFFNLPNQLTTMRIILSVVLFCFLANEYFLTSFVLFIIAAGTDWLDGYFARKYSLVTNLGRILDPFADKVIICGTFIFLGANASLLNMPWGLRVWMVVVIVARELLVTALRSFIEERGGDFSAKWSGKIKMVLQCFAAGVCIFFLSYDNRPPDWCRWLLIASVWTTVISTVYSGAVYVQAAVKSLV